MSAKTIPIAVMRLGRLVATPNALASITQDDILLGIQRHQAGDWGNLTEEDRMANAQALVQGTPGTAPGSGSSRRRTAR